MPIRLIVFAIALTAMAWLATAACGQVATSDEALTVARNWVALIIDKTGGWGESPTAEVTGIQEYKRGPDAPVLGYFCRVSPQGWIVISRYKDLASVKAYSETYDLDPAEDVGMAAYVKDGLEGMIRNVELQLGKSMTQATSKEIQGTLNVCFRSSWKLLGGDVGDNDPSVPASVPPIVGANYAGGQVLTTTTWHQGNPYYLQCPPGSGCDHCVVGCVATAGAQAMRYWCWPPTGSGSPYDDAYDWPNMPNSASSGSSQAIKDAVSELSREVGIAVGMSYTCGASSADTADMEGVYEGPYRYAGCDWETRYTRIIDIFGVDVGYYNHSADEWFNMIKGQLNVNRVIQYRIKNHSMVCDGWQEVGSPVVKQYHMNYGWNDGATAWYTLDALLQVETDGTIKDEKMVINIRPNCALGATISGTYALPSYPYRYFDLDADCAGTAHFDAGHNLQFLPKVVLKATTTSDCLYIDGATSLVSRLFTRGDPSRGARIDSGTIKMGKGGCIRLN